MIEENVNQNKEFEEGYFIIGRPAKIVRKVTEEEEVISIEKLANNYVALSKNYL